MIARALVKPQKYNAPNVVNSSVAKLPAGMK